jgi:hypothetical protein
MSNWRERLHYLAAGTALVVMFTLPFVVTELLREAR